MKSNLNLTHNKTRMSSTNKNFHHSITLTIETNHHRFVALFMHTQNQNVFQGWSHCWTDAQASFDIKHKLRSFSSSFSICCCCRCCCCRRSIISFQNRFLNIYIYLEINPKNKSSTRYFEETFILVDYYDQAMTKLPVFS